MITVSFVLLLFSGGALEGYRHYENLSECLAVKRKIKRNATRLKDFDSRWSCQKMTVELQQGPDGRYNITRLITEVKQ
jgi:hypothetical protein